MNPSVYRWDYQKCHSIEISLETSFSGMELVREGRVSLEASVLGVEKRARRARGREMVVWPGERIPGGGKGGEQSILGMMCIILGSAHSLD